MCLYKGECAFFYYFFCKLGVFAVVYLHAVVVGTLAVEMAAVVVYTAVIQRAEAHEPMLQGVVPLLMHVIMPYHILLTGESL